MTSEEQEMQILRAEIAQERQMKEMLEQSMSELDLTVRELDKRMDSIDGENNEWKTRYDMQVEMNEQLSSQIAALMEKLQDAKDTYNKSRQPKSHRSPGLDEVTPVQVKRMAKEKQILEGQLRDLEWRLDQESKAYHKANDVRKRHQMEINVAKSSVDATRRHGNISHRGNHDSTRSSLNHNIPQDQRVIDPRHGPIRKTAAVKSLPRLD